MESVQVDFELVNKKFVDSEKCIQFFRGWKEIGAPVDGKNVYLCRDNCTEDFVGFVNIGMEAEGEGTLFFGVVPAERRKGIGSKLLKWSIEKCNELGLETIWLRGTEENRKVMTDFLKKAGALAPGGILAKKGEWEFFIRIHKEVSAEYRKQQIQQWNLSQTAVAYLDDHDWIYPERPEDGGVIGKISHFKPESPESELCQAPLSRYVLMCVIGFLFGISIMAFQGNPQLTGAGVFVLAGIAGAALFGSYVYLYTNWFHKIYVTFYDGPFIDEVQQQKGESVEKEETNSISKKRDGRAKSI